VFGVFLEQFNEDCLGFRPVLIEEVNLFLPEFFSPLFSGQQWCIESQMTQQVKRICVGMAGLGTKFLEVNSSFLQFFNRHRSLLKIRPLLSEFFRTCRAAPCWVSSQSHQMS